MDTWFFSISWLLPIVLQCHGSDILTLFTLDMYPVIGLLDHMVVILFNFWGISILFSIMAICKCPLCSTTLTALVILSHFDNSHFGWNEIKWYLIVVLAYISLMINDVEHLSPVSWSFGYLLQRNIFLGLLSNVSKVICFFFYCSFEIPYIVWISTFCHFDDYFLGYLKVS
jgi:hypothetical protein